MLDAADQNILDDVKVHGFHSMGVHADAEGPEFRYSVGFWETLGSPEVITFGLDLKLMHNMLWGMFRQLKAGARLVDGARWSELIEGFDCISRPVHHSQMREYFGYALWYRHYRKHDAQDLQAYQLFWPGTEQGLYPWDPGCVDEVRDYQPALYLPREIGLA